MTSWPRLSIARAVGRPSLPRPTKPTFMRNPPKSSPSRGDSAPPYSLMPPPVHARPVDPLDRLTDPVRSSIVVHRLPARLEIAVVVDYREPAFGQPGVEGVE